MFSLDTAQFKKKLKTFDIFIKYKYKILINIQYTIYKIYSKYIPFTYKTFLTFHIILLIQPIQDYNFTTRKLLSKTINVENFRQRIKSK